MVKLGILQWKDYPGLLGWAQCNHKDPYKERGREEKQSQRREEVGVIDAKGPVGQEMQAAFRSWKNGGLVVVGF